MHAPWPCHRHPSRAASRPPQGDGKHAAPKQSRSRDALHPGFGIPTATPVLCAALERKGGGAPEGANLGSRIGGCGRPLRIFRVSLRKTPLTEDTLRKTRRGLASRRSTAALATPIKAVAQSRPCFLGRAAAGVTCRDVVPVQRGTPRAGHNAGRSDARTAREQGYEPCPQEPHPPPSIGRHRLTSLRRTNRMQVSMAVTSVKWSSHLL
jgi:hypothetical protein